MSSQPALRKTFWSLERAKVLFKTRTKVSVHSWSFWNGACLNWRLVEKLFRANSTSCVRAGVLPWVPVLEACFEHTWLKLPHGIVKTRFRANTTRRVRAKRCPENFLGPANTVNMQTFLADFGSCCSAKIFVYCDWSPTWHVKAIALTYTLPNSNHTTSLDTVSNKGKNHRVFIVQELRP